MLLSPQPFRVEVSGRAVAQPVRRCITHLLPVRPTCVGRTNLTSQGAPKSVTHGEPCDRQRICRTRQLTRDAERETSRRQPFRGTFPRLFARFAHQSRPLHRPRKSRQTGPQMPPLSRGPSRFFAQNSPPLGLGVQTTSLPTPPTGGIRSPSKNQTRWVRFSRTLPPPSSEQDSIRPKDTTPRNTKDYLTATAVNPDASLLRCAPWNSRYRTPSRWARTGVDCC
jgi:hypothetical protein